MSLRFTYLEVPVGSPRPDSAWAAWRGAGGIGFYDDVDIAITVGEGDGRPLEATARPTVAQPRRSGGVFALRGFELAASDWGEFLALSVDAWPEFEEVNDAIIEGLFRAVGGPDAIVDALLVTRYPSLARWESSRMTIRPDTAAGRNFLRRRELTRRSVVRIAGPFWNP